MEDFSYANTTVMTRGGQTILPSVYQPPLRTYHCPNAVTCRHRSAARPFPLPVSSIFLALLLVSCVFQLVFPALGLPLAVAAAAGAVFVAALVQGEGPGGGGGGGELWPH